MLPFHEELLTDHVPILMLSAFLKQVSNHKNDREVSSLSNERERERESMCTNKCRDFFRINYQWNTEQ